MSFLVWTRLPRVGWFHSLLLCFIWVAGAAGAFFCVIAHPANKLPRLVHIVLRGGSASLEVHSVTRGAPLNKAGHTLVLESKRAGNTSHLEENSKVRLQQASR